jgi:hypothetical protein
MSAQTEFQTLCGVAELCNRATSLATADEVLMRVVPEKAGDQSSRLTVAAVIQRDKAELLEVLHLLADGLDTFSEVNLRTGTMLVVVDGEFFKRFRRVMSRHGDRSVLPFLEREDRP